MKKVIPCVLICIFLICVFFLGKSLGSAENTTAGIEVAIPEESAEQSLRISANIDKNEGFKVISLEQGNYQEISYLNLINVSIEIDGTTMQLEDALLEGFTSVDELIAHARKDAANGLCGESSKSENGLTEFKYHYPEFTIRYIYDLYETPDGRQHLIADFLIYGVGSDPQFMHAADEQTGRPIDYEDWGLDFEIKHLTSSSITIQCSQSGGQQIGKLNAGGIVLYRKNPNTDELEYVDPLSEEGNNAVFAGGKNWEPNPDDFLTMGGTKELSFNLQQLYGLLTDGEYELGLHIVDWYNKEDVHSLMRNYYDTQWYAIEFTID